MRTPLRVLLIEDSEDDAALVLLELERGGFAPAAKRVETEEAMASALVREEWDVVISDHALPAFSAPAALAVLKDTGKDIPFIVVSGAIGEEMAVLLMKTGAHDYVMKDNLARLVPAIKRELRDAEARRERWRLEEEVRHAALREQQRLGQEIHDGLGQQLVGIALLCKALGDRLRAKGIAEAAEANEIEALTVEALQQARSLALGLYPVDMTHGGLPAALRRLAEDAARAAGIPCEFADGPDAPPLDDAKALYLYRIAQEAINNAVRHAKATRITVDLRTAGERVHLTVQDDGVGIPGPADRGAGLGLKTMRHRAETIGATLDVKRHPAGGTAVTCSVPPRVSP